MQAASKQVYKIVPLGTPALHQQAKALTRSDLRSDEIQTVLRDMNTEMNGEGGIGIAENIQVFPYTLFINPHVTMLSDSKITMYESCLSTIDKIAKVDRCDKIQIDFIDQEEKRRSILAEGFIAGAMQHEYDHLEGILCIDRVESKKEGLWEVETFVGEFPEVPPTPAGSWQEVDISANHPSAWKE